MSWLERFIAYAMSNPPRRSPDREKYRAKISHFAWHMKSVSYFSVRCLRATFVDSNFVQAAGDLRIARMHQDLAKKFTPDEIRNS